MKLKHVTTTILSVALLLCAFTTGASAQENIPDPAAVKQQYQATAHYVMDVMQTGVKQGEMYKNAQAVTSIVKSGIACDALKSAYLADLKAQLDANGGKLLYGGQESPGSYALAIEALDAIGSDPAAFNGYNLFALLDGVKAADTNLYMNAYAARAMGLYGDKVTNTASKTIILSAIKATFMEQDGAAGWDNWGINADNNGTVIYGLAPYYGQDDGLHAQIDKAMAFNETMRTAAGYDNGYGANASTTAAVLMGLSAMEKDTKAADAYTLLEQYQSKDVPGAYLYGTSPNAFASQQALTALDTYYTLLTKNSQPPEEPTTQAPTQEGTTVPEPTTAENTEPTAAVSTTVKTTGHDIPKTGDSAMLAVLPGVFVLISAAAVIGLRKKKQGTAC